MDRHYRAGGPVPKDGFYIERFADNDVVRILTGGEYCHVVAPRQAGKSSLIRRVSETLEAKGIRCATIDPQGSNTTNAKVDAWFFDIADMVNRRLTPEFDLKKFWSSHSANSPSRRWLDYLEQGPLARIEAPIVIFVDEVDSIGVLPFGDDFFASVRAIFHARKDVPAYARLTFCLCGVVFPADFKTNSATTPFNIGKPVRLDDFTHKEASGLLPGLARFGEAAGPILDAVFAWTNGHPYMMQRMCEAFVHELDDEDPQPAMTPEERVEHYVRTLFLESSTPDINLSSIERLFDRKKSVEKAGQLLELYGQIVRGRVRAVEKDPLHRALILTGLATVRQDGAEKWLVPRNKITQQHFSADWVKAKQSERIVSEPLAQWKAAGRGGDYLLSGRQLKDAQRWAAQTFDMSADEREFITKSIDAADKVDRRNQMLLGAAALITLCGAIAAMWQWRAEAKARRGAEKARRQLAAAVASAEQAAMKLERTVGEKDDLLAERAKQQQALETENREQTARSIKLRGDSEKVGRDAAAKLQLLQDAFGACEKARSAAETLALSGETRAQTSEARLRTCDQQVASCEPALAKSRREYDTCARLLKAHGPAAK